MTAPYDTLVPGEQYVFVFGNGVFAVVGTFDEIAPDGLLLVTKDEFTYRINPALLIYVRSV